MAQYKQFKHSKRTRWIIVSGVALIVGVVLASRLIEQINLESEFDLNGNNNNDCDNDDFPLKKGSCGARVKNVQIWLDVPPTGKFGSETLTALKKKYNRKQITEAEYNSVVNGYNLTPLF